MCGICGIINFQKKPVQAEPVRRMMQKMKHRGPDDEGLYLDGNVGLGFVRLSILDLSPKGHQPMFDEGNRYVIIHNGEVYNYIELRRELGKYGYSFHTNTDTEVVLKSFMHWGEDCLDKFNGMWAFVIYDTLNRELFISRDRFGIKPFYYFLDDQQFIFASEIPPILLLLKSNPTPNNQVIFDYLVFNRTDQNEETFFQEVKKLQHGQCIKVSAGGDIKSGRRNRQRLGAHVFIHKWYHLRERVERNEGFRNSEEFKETFRSAVGLRLRSDVPVGVCLSGGLDSSSIASVLIKDYKKHDLNTFSAIYQKGQFGDESEYIRELDETIQNMFFIRPGAETLFKDIEQFVQAHGEPIPSTSPYAQFKVMQLAKKHVVVTLDGQGADEELAGYHYFFGLFFKDLLLSFRWFTLSREIYNYLVKHQSLYGLKTFFYFLLPEKLRTSARIKEKGYLYPEFERAYANGNSIAGNLYGSGTLKDALLDHFEFKLEHLLKWEDRNSMWFSLESRVPFLDHRLVEKILAMDGRAKIKDGMTKVLLRDAMKGIIPEKIRSRKDKMGFGTPQSEWFRTAKFQKYILELLQSESFKSRKIINADSALRLYGKHLSGEIDTAREIWKWVHLELWFRTFID